MGAHSSDGVEIAWRRIEDLPWCKVECIDYAGPRIG